MPTDKASRTPFDSQLYFFLILIVLTFTIATIGNIVDALTPYGGIVFAITINTGIAILAIYLHWYKKKVPKKNQTETKK